MEKNFLVSSFIHEFDGHCKKMHKKSFPKGEIITTYIEKRNQLCALIKGEADFIRYDFNGTKTIIDHFSENAIFGEVFYPVNTNNELFVLAKTNCEVLFMDYAILDRPCDEGCHFHEILSHNLPLLLRDKIIEMNTRIEILTKRATRDKLITYFNLLSSRKFSKSFHLDCSLTDLADYLSVDRSAMMRELKNLEEDGFMNREGNHVTLLHY